MFDYDVVVIGAGTGGLTVAKLTAKARRRVLLIEREKPGGDCLWTGCVPTKALIECARRYHEARTSAVFGVTTENVRFDFDAVRRYISEAQRQAGEVDSPDTIRDAGVEFVGSEASFVDAHTVAVAGRRVTATNVVIATGGEPSIAGIPGLREAAPDTNVEALSWESLPGSLCIIGGGPIGIEFAQALGRIGVRVTVIEAAARILEREDEKASTLITGVLEREGVSVIAGAAVASVEREGERRRVRFGRAGRDEMVECDRILVATGRRAELASLQLRRAGVSYTPHGITVDAGLHTSQQNIFAVGDVVGGYQFTHVAEAQGRLVANIIKGGRIGRRFQKWSDRVVPRVTYTDPEVAAVGLGEMEARKRYGGVRAWELPLTAVDRAIVMGTTEGYLKLITAPAWERWLPPLRSIAGDQIVGASLVAPHAGDLLPPIVNAMKLRLPIGLLALSMQAYPTLALGVRQVAGLPFDA